MFNSTNTSRVRNPAVTYGLTVLAVLVATGLRWLFHPILGETLPFFAFYFAAIFSAWYGGILPALLSLALSIVCGTLLLHSPYSSLLTGDIVLKFHALRFIAVSLAVAVICEQLHRSQRRADLRWKLVNVTLASIGDAVITTDNHGNVTLMNGVAESLTGWKIEAALGQPLDTIFKIINEQTRQPVENPATRALREGVIVGLANHTILVARDQTETPIDDSAAPIRDQNGVVYGCVLVFRNITERKKHDDELRQLAAELSEASHRKDEFLATLAHELRNPLAPIRNGLEIMRLAATDEIAVERARTMVERQLVGLVRLVDDLMDISRITRGKIELRKQQVSLAAILNNAIDTSRPLVEVMEHELTVMMPRQPVVVEADPTRLGQVFSNLLNNAAKYSDRGSHIWLSVEQQGDKAVISVKDEGIGIPADQLPRIFDMFMQIDRSLEKSQGGLGIGLTLVKQLVELHGGTIEPKSEGQGKGSQFVVRLPVVMEANQPQGGNPQKNVERPESSLRILIVDDNRDGADSLVMMLRMMGHQTRMAYDGVQGVEMADEFRPDLVLLDIGLPKLNGYEACRRIREQPWGKGVILIAVTGWGQENDRRRSREAGFDHHLVKPVDPQAFMTLLTRLHAGKSADINPKPAR